MPEKSPPLGRSPMAAGSWVRSLHCKSTAAEDVATTAAALPKKPHHHLLARFSCASSGDIHSNVSSSKPKPKSSSKPSPKAKKNAKARPSAAVPPSPPPGTLGPLPVGHSSRQVVEIIFLSSWSPLPPPAPPAIMGGAFTGVVEMLFRVHNQARAVARFEEYRAAVRARAGGAARSAADGNEMMRFSPAPSHGRSAEASGEDPLCVRTFDGSGGAHANGRGPESGRRAMFLCRVIAGRVAEVAGAEPGALPGKEYDSIRGGKGELVVFDRRAVLPCFLIIYKL